MSALQIWAMRGGVFHVHKPGCGDTTRREYATAEPWGVMYAASLADVVWEIYPPADFGYFADEWEDYAADVRVFPCVSFTPNR